MTVLGKICIKDFLLKTEGKVRGNIVTDAKDRWYAADYAWRENSDGSLDIFKVDGTGDVVTMQPTIDLDESLVAFFGLYSGDGAKGSEDPSRPGKVKPSVSFSQREPNLVRFAVDQFRKLFSKSLHFNFSLGEDSAYFMTGTGYALLLEYYGGTLPPNARLVDVRPNLNDADQKYMSETRPVEGTNEEHLTFYYQHKKAMEEILTEKKRNDVIRSGIVLGSKDKVSASLRRPFKKGARNPGGSSRSDETYVGGINGFGEFFLKIMHEIEDSILDEKQVSTQGLIVWDKVSGQNGELINVQTFFTSHPYGEIGGRRPSITPERLHLIGRWPAGKELQLKKELRINPLWCYVAGLYLAEGSTPKSIMFSMFNSKPGSLSLGFTSSENISLELMIRTLKMLFQPEDCISTWKVKVGSQYFPELVVIGLKNAVPMLRGGQSGDGKMRTMEISLAIKEWALQVATCLNEYADKYSHVEPTGAGLARIDISASSSLCKWYFALLMYSVFGNIVTNPKVGFVNE